MNAEYMDVHARRLHPPQIFAKANSLPIDNDSEKQKNRKKIQAMSNSSKIAGNITLVYFFIDLVSVILYFFIFYHDDHPFEKTLFHKTMPFSLGL